MDRTDAMMLLRRNLPNAMSLSDSGKAPATSATGDLFVSDLRELRNLFMWALAAINLPWLGMVSRYQSPKIHGDGGWGLVTSTLGIWDFPKLSMSRMMLPRSTPENQMLKYFFAIIFIQIPPGKRLHSYGKLPLLRGRSTINGPCSIATLNYQRVFSLCSFLRARMEFQYYDEYIALARRGFELTAWKGVPEATRTWIYGSSSAVPEMQQSYYNVNPRLINHGFLIVGVPC
jgi:hypothetical protein